MLPSFSGFVSTHELPRFFQDSTDPITLYQDLKYAAENFEALKPFVHVTVQLVPGIAVAPTFIADKETGLVAQIQLARKSVRLIQ